MNNKQNLYIVHEKCVRVEKDARIHVGHHEVYEEPCSGAHPEHGGHVLQAGRILQLHVVEDHPGLCLTVPGSHRLQYVVVDGDVIVDDVHVDPHAGQQVESLQEDRHLLHLAVSLLALCEGVQMEFNKSNSPGLTYLLELLTQTMMNKFTSSTSIG